MSLRYGLVQARIKIPVARGIWPRFWMLGQELAAPDGQGAVRST